MIKEYNFKFDELIINQEEISSVLGYSDSQLPAPFEEYVKMALYDAKSLTDSRSAYRILGEVKIDYKRYSLLAEEQKFNLGKAVCNELKVQSDWPFMFVLSAKQSVKNRQVCLRTTTLF